MSANMTRREKTSEYFAPPLKLANENVRFINCVNNGVHEVRRGKEGLKSLITRH